MVVTDAAAARVAFSCQALSVGACCKCSWSAVTAIASLLLLELLNLFVGFAGVDASVVHVRSRARSQLRLFVYRLCASARIGEPEHCRRAGWHAAQMEKETRGSTTSQSRAMSSADIERRLPSSSPISEITIRLHRCEPKAQKRSTPQENQWFAAPRCKNEDLFTTLVITTCATRRLHTTCQDLANHSHSLVNTMHTLSHVAHTTCTID